MGDELCNMHDNPEMANLDFILVVGGFDSSNTAHLLEIPQMRGVRSFHINEADCITAGNEITHRQVDGSVATDEFLPLGLDRPLRVGVTSGASTPDKAVQDALGRIIMLDQGMRAKGKATVESATTGQGHAVVKSTDRPTNNSDGKGALRAMLLKS